MRRRRRRRRSGERRVAAPPSRRARIGGRRALVGEVEHVGQGGGRPRRVDRGRRRRGRRRPRRQAASALRRDWRCHAPVTVVVGKRSLYGERSSTSRRSARASGRPAPRDGRAPVRRFAGDEPQYAAPGARTARRPCRRSASTPRPARRARRGPARARAGRRAPARGGVGPSIERLEHFSGSDSSRIFHRTRFGTCPGTHEVPSGPQATDRQTMRMRRSLTRATRAGGPVGLDGRGGRARACGHDARPLGGVAPRARALRVGADQSRRVPRAHPRGRALPLRRGPSAAAAARRIRLGGPDHRAGRGALRS